MSDEAKKAIDGIKKLIDEIEDIDIQIKAMGTFTILLRILKEGHQ